MTAAQSFSPETVTISVGDTVTWVNGSSEQHTVTAEESALPGGADYFASGNPASEDEANDDVSGSFIGPGESYAHTFETPGTYRYYCIPHHEAGMAGRIVVEEG
jgi:plastocyanin